MIMEGCGLIMCKMPRRRHYAAPCHFLFFAAIVEEGGGGGGGGPGVKAMGGVPGHGGM